MIKQNLKVNLEFENEKQAGIVYRSVLMPKRNHERRSETKVNINKNVVSFDIIADDLSALKASINSYLKLVILSKDLIDMRRF